MILAALLIPLAFADVPARISPCGHDCEPITLVVGVEKITELGFAAHAGAGGMSVGNPGILAVTLLKLGDDRQQLSLRATSAGQTSLVLRDSAGEVRAQIAVTVWPIDVESLEKEVASALGAHRKLKVRRLGARVIIEGEADELAPFGLIAAFAQKAPDHVVSVAKLSDAYWGGLAAKAQKEIQAFAPGAKVRAVEGKLWLEGKVASDDDAKKAAEIAKLMLPDMLPPDPLAKSPDARILPPRSVVQNFLKVGK